MGFCFFNNVGGRGARARCAAHGLGRVAIFDFDVHHGNGTQHLFEERADVFYASAHQYPFYPGTGAAAERGVGAGEGATLNVPLPAGAGDDEYGAVLHERRSCRRSRAFAPDLLLVSAGFDAWRGDPLGGMRVTEAGFAEWGRLLRDAAPSELCGGRMLVVLEGGYDLDALPRAGEERSCWPSCGPSPTVGDARDVAAAPARCARSSAARVEEAERGLDLRVALGQHLDARPRCRSARRRPRRGSGARA